VEIPSSPGERPTDDVQENIQHCHAGTRTENAAALGRRALIRSRKVHTLMQRTGQAAEFDAYVAAVRAAHQRKRNFIRLLDHARWR
jgi:replicative DNA helicase